MFAKVVILSAALAAVQASHIVGLVNTGASVNARQQDDFGNYAFNYGIVDGLGATNSRAEVGDAHGNKQGSYTLTDIDGRARRVDYVADGLGFRASVKTNEPGTALSAPAAAIVDSPYAAPIAPAVVGHSVAAVAPIAPVAAVAPVISVAAPAAISAPVYAGNPALFASKEIVTTNTVDYAAPLGYAAGHIGVIGPVGYAAGPVGIAAGHVGYVGSHGVAAPLGYAGHLGYGASLAKAIY